MGVVYLAEDPLLNRQVAIKTLDLSVDDPARKDVLGDFLLRDARAAAGLSHPNIVNVYDVVAEAGAAYLVMEYVAGETLAARLGRQAKPDPAFATGVLRQMAAALDYTHARGVIHRDIKPGNVMIDAAGNAKIMDFGIARISDARTVAPAGIVLGTVEYMAPEQIKGEPVDGRADQFSLATVAYQMLTGTTPYGQQTFTTLAYKLVHEMPPPARAANQALPPDVDAVLAKALSKLPAERFGACGEFAGALEAAIAGANGLPTLTMANAAVPPPARSGGLGLMAGAAIGAVILGGGLLLWRPWTGGHASNSRPPVTAAAAPPSAPAVIPAAGKIEKPAARPEPQHRTVSADRSAVPSSGTGAKSSGERQAAKASQPPAPEDELVESQPDPEEASLPQPVATAFQEGKQLLNSGAYAGAVAAFSKAIALHPKFVRAYLLRGQAQQRQGQTEAAILDYSQVILLMPRNVIALAQRGMCYARLQQDDRALADFGRALEIHSDLPQALNGRGALLLRRNDPNAAIRDFTEAIRRHPDLALAYQNRARARRALGDNAGAAADVAAAQKLRHEP
jgi:Flp pilus assembly protein TadD